MKQEAQTIASELANTFKVLRECCGAPGSLEYFIDLAEKYFIPSEQPKRNEVLILGSSFPEELLLANKLSPHWIIGGGLSVGASVDSIVPRDTDSISRSVLGYLENYLTDTDTKTPIIIPVTSDNQRKIAYLLQEEGRNVVTIDIPPELEASKLYSSLTDRLNDIMSEVSISWNFPGKSRKLRRTVQAIYNAKKVLFSILEDFDSDISGMLKMFLLNTYFYASDMLEWSENLEKLAMELKKFSSKSKLSQKKPGVLIIGSPILFPNYKVPILLESAGLSILGSCDSISVKILSGTTRSQKENRNSFLRDLVQYTYGNDCSGAFVSNRALYNQASHLLDTLDVQGVIFHIIKGQIEYDFELEQMEQLFAAHNLPIFRLETDYHDNDVEQLRIRLEAFAELLTQDAII